jgi:hypothetical protein
MTSIWAFQRVRTIHGSKNQVSMLAVVLRVWLFVVPEYSTSEVS